MGFIDTWAADKHLGDIGVLIAFKTSKTKLNFQRNHCGQKRKLKTKSWNIS